MEMKQKRSVTWCSWCATQRRVLRCTMGVVLVFLFFAFCPPAQAVGPYTAGSNTVVDQGTGLEWQKSDDATPRNWQDSLAYCESLSLDSKTDWRLPSIRELKSIADVSRYYPATDPAFSCQLSSYWSATTVTDYPTTSAWHVHFGNGDDIWDVKAKKYNVRCVRAGLSGL
ncbi:MAG: DUF1566 domain-containing protein [Proteobacteria bacterium]|nr:DUF1566 domain-containing protein [Pseudomonadota bacterium]MBU1649949.1 DUF1566 domain-containing protein [Pseudomonadota bacterium]